jgi:hypothetical protein
MTRNEIESWLLEKLESQIAKAKVAMEKVLTHLNLHDWRAASDAHREIDYWLSRCKNTQRLIDELDEVTK